MKKKLCLVLALVMVVCLFSGCGSQPSSSGGSAPSQSQAAEATPPEPASSEAESYVIKLSTASSAKSIECLAVQEAIDNIKERTNGAVDVQMYTDNSLLVGQDAVEAVMSNSAFIYMTDVSWFSDYVPEFNTIYAPYLYSSYDVFFEFFNSDLYNSIIAKADDAGIVVLCNGLLQGYRNVYADKPIHTAADIKGLSLRVPDSDIYIAAFSCMDAAYNALDWSETYNALETGMIHGVEGIASTVVLNTLWETIDDSYYSETHHLINYNGFFCGSDFWATIPAEYQAIIVEELQNAIDSNNEQVLAKELEYEQTMAENGVTIVNIDDYSSFKEAASVIYEDLAMGQEVLDAVAEIEAKLG